MMNRSSMVNFPRFQEQRETSSVSGRELVQRASQRRWISDSAVEIHNHAARTESRFTVVDTDMRRALDWWGVYHHTKSRPTLGVSGPAAFMPRMGNIFLWMTHSKHQYLWDQQAIDGRCTELTLCTFSKQDDSEPIGSGMKELASLMIDSYNPQEQRLVLNGPNGWHEPTVIERDRADSMLYAMTRISFHEIVMQDATRQVASDMQLPLSKLA